MSPRTEKQFESIRSEKIKLITETALRLFAQHGYESTSVSMIAKEAGISKGLMYNYFESKNALLKLVMEEGMKGFMEVLNIQNEKVISRDGLSLLTSRHT
jgi:AcrR family transcriptional regulator